MSVLTMQETIIQTNNVNVYYGEKHAVKNISMDIEKNSVTAFIGPSGCGKSTLLRSLNRMNDLVPSCRVEGSIIVDGIDINSSQVNIESLRQVVGMVFQRANPFFKSIYENIAFAPRFHGMTNKRDLDELVESSLQKAALWDEVKDRLRDSALSLSGGQQQRLCIARAIAMQPTILLLDEPASALDPISTMKIEELVMQLKDEYTIVIVTHNLHQAARISEKTAFFLMGELIEMDETGKIFTSPESEKTEDYISGRFG
ncbi:MULTISPECIES: phosphate ABC transporter ATP-binding protein PstB [Brevibacillus]|uniref:Probable phosphate ABC transporter ATP-binding protein n=1 Tax=Brevibacillus brevis (strain 47 / JCM 6285 / NBRC 100599) TaxID=358681 RepID=C0ZK04_BREBN|nr:MULTISPECIES: phosphate ABC transporter ATP-binding protein PstB [Bacillales]NRR05133.1 phosphate ABC transporter ATP-binding protein [Brevibacillus sp. RS1.1]OUQ88492.1 phosphate ABC transporter ATP-binding protein [Brevibacillus brevis]TQR30706.1 phosphate ABC transporter ATP-binding protein [Lysinibacillus sp. SDF0063]WGV60641.1 phosphate ABC transporter ATP-binding protein PstB [Brevibacillus brevis]BAH41455.1 probable phosphate ABC transporter ATP-binding protein [Brevibacillus brevis 